MLKLKNITKSFPGAFAPILNNINLKLKSGDFCVIIGANGSGKSTLIKTISGEYVADSGSVTIDGNNIAQVVQDINKGTIPEMSLLENMALSQMRSSNAEFAFYSRHKQNIIAQIKSLGIGLENYIDYPLSSLSGGQRQMIATVMAISSQPNILLLDEHTSALDPKMQKTLIEYTANAINKNKLTCAMITHKLDDAIKYGNRLIMLDCGQIVFEAAGKKKSSLKINELLDLFHHYEDLHLLSKRAK